MSTARRYSATPSNTDASLTALFRPESVVVVGASTDPQKLGGSMVSSLELAPTPLYLVNRRGGPGMWTTIAAAAQAAEVPPDLAVLCIPAAQCPGAIRECAAAGIKAAVICAGGFAETGDAGAELQDELETELGTGSLRLLGPNTSGFFVPHQRLFATFVPGAARVEPGGVAIVASSGGLNHALAFALQRTGTGISLAVGLGTGLDVGAAEVIGYLRHDEQTRAVLLHVESIDDGPRLLEAVRLTSRDKPVAALVVGRNDVGDFARSHTGALATSWHVTRHLLRQAGAVVVDDEQDLALAGQVLTRVRIKPRPSVGVGLVTAQAGPGLIIADRVQRTGITLPSLSARTRDELRSLLPPMTFQGNPVDTGRPGPRHSDVVATVAADPAVDVVAVYGLTEPVVDLPAAVARSATRDDCVALLGVDGPSAEVVTAREQADKHDLVCVDSPTGLATAVTILAEDAMNQDAALVIRPDGVSVGRMDGRSRSRLPDTWTEDSAKTLLEHLGIATPPRRLCQSRQEAAEALRVLGGPVVAKLVDATVLHKSDIDGVRLGLRSELEVLDAFDDLSALGSGPVLVESMVESGTELVVGVRRDPVFGPVALVGVGGVAAEVYSDFAVVALPAPLKALAELPDRLTARALIDGFRGAPEVPREALAQILAKLGSVVVESNAIAEIEINPLRATRAGLVALDAVVVTRDSEDPGDPGAATTKDSPEGATVS